MQGSMVRLREEIQANPEIIDTLLCGKFNWDTVISGAKDIGVELSTSDIEDYFEQNYSPTSADSPTTYFAHDDEGGEYRELLPEELGSVGGGTTIVAAVVIVAAAAVVVVAASIVVGVSVGAGAVVATVTVATSHGVGGGGSGGGIDILFPRPRERVFTP